MKRLHTWRQLKKLPPPGDKLRWHCITVYSCTAVRTSRLANVQLQAINDFFGLRRSLCFDLTLRLLMSHIYGAPSKARNANVVYMWTYVWQRWNSLFLFAAQCFNTESMQRGFLCHICSWQSVYTQMWHRKPLCIDSVLKHCAANRKRLFQRCQT